ncbi:MAG: DUF2271 domain-containing protein [Termitinemataceae bacterium]
MNFTRRSALIFSILFIFVYSVWGESLSLRIEPGPHWKETTFFFIFPFSHYPQMAAWIETPEGRVIKPLLISQSAATKRWRGNPEGGRPESLPVWYYKGASIDTQYIDTTTSPTPTKGTEIKYSRADLIPGAEYIVRLEVNNSFDYNTTWPKKAKPGQSGYSGVNGQPSLIYEAVFRAGIPGETMLYPVGQGSVDGSDGSIRPHLEGLTTALSIVSRAVLIQE